MLALLSLLGRDSLQAMPSESQDGELVAQFAAPPAEARILKIIHSWPDEPERQDALIRQLLSQGFGGVVCNVSFQDYLESEARWQAFVRAVRKARRRGMVLWLYDERGYPSGTAGGLTLQGHPELEAQGLLIAEASTEGERVTLKLPPGALIRVAAFPETQDGLEIERALDLSDAVHQGRLDWTPPEGTWRVLAITRNRLYEGTHAQLSLADKLPYINLLMSEATARFLQLTHERYAAHLGKDLDRWFVATFTDEPSLMSVFLRPMPYRVLPWSPGLAETFRRRRGYTLEPLLPALAFPAGGREKKVRYDFWRTVGELVAENFFGQIQTWCREHGLASGGHLLAEEMLTAHTPLYGNFFQCVRRLDAPSIDCLTSIPQEVPWFIARLISSVADLEGRSITMCETSDHSQVYRPQGDERPPRLVSEEEIRGTLNRLLLGGITTITSYYSFRGLSDEQLRRLNTWVGRCSLLLRGGHQVTDIAMLYPTETLWVHYQPGGVWGRESFVVNQIASSFRTASANLYRSGRDFRYVDSQALMDATVQGDTFQHGALRWRVLVLPWVDTLPEQAWAQIAAFWRGGGTVIALGLRPENSDREFPSPHVQKLGAEMFGTGTDPSIQTNAAGGVGVFLPAGSETLLSRVLDTLVEREVRLHPSDNPIRVTHRRIRGQEVYFVINDSPTPWEGEITFAAQGEGTLWNPHTGARERRVSPEHIALRLQGYDARVFTFSRARLPEKRPVQSGTLAGFSLAAQPTGRPDLAKGEFVRGEIHPDREHTRPGRSVWRALGTLTRGNVDTYLFLIFRYPDFLNLQGAALLAFDTWVPEGQHTPTQLLVILRDRDGSDYLATTGRPLSTPGYARVFLPLERFQRAGWSTDADGRLDWKHIVAISVGWGGYYGQAGEQVSFSVSSPSVGR